MARAAVKTTPTMAHAAGTVPYRRRRGGLEILLTHRPRYDDWSLPKGHLDNGETYETAALRETVEEAGVTGQLRGYVGSIGYRVKSKNKVIRYWMLASEAEAFRPNSEVDEIKWLAPKAAAKLASYTRDRNLIDRAVMMLEQPSRSTVYLVRHANAGSRDSADPRDHKRKLSERGRRQAAAVTARLLRVPITTVESSQYIRCVSTVRPLARALDLAVVKEPVLTEGTAPSAVIKHLRMLSRETAVVCTHGDVIGGMIQYFAATGVKLQPALEWKKASVWTLELDQGEVIRGSYRRPPV